MAFELQYRNTFIDAKEEDEEGLELGPLRPRARSAPPGREHCNFSVERAEEEAMRTYVGGLVENASHLRTAETQELPTQDGTVSVPPGVPPDMSSETSSSEGSLGHPWVCRRPCIYFAAGHCDNGQACSFCHLPHEEKKAKLDKKQRGLLQRCSRPQLVALILQPCVGAADRVGCASKAAELLGLLHKQSDRASLHEVLAEREVRSVERTLARMNLSSLVGLVTHHEQSQVSSTGVSENVALNACVEKLRLLCND